MWGFDASSSTNPDVFKKLYIGDFSDNTDGSYDKGSYIYNNVKISF